MSTPEGKAAVLANATECQLFVGNPGAGKSTLANATAGEVVFKSGCSMGNGKTTELDIYLKDGIAYVDTPGLADQNLRQQAAAAISAALKAGGVFRVIFVCKQDSGRVRVQDVTTMNLVLNACDEITENKFGVVVNMCSNTVIKKMEKDEEGRKLFGSILQQSLPRKTSFVLFLKKHDDLEDQEDTLAQMSELPGYTEFLNQLPKVTLTKDKAQDVKADQFQELYEEMEKKDAAINNLLVECKKANDNAANASAAALAAKDTIENMKADHEADMERLRKEAEEARNQQFTFGSLIGGIASAFGADGAGTKRTLDEAFGVGK